jgi:hypothetical protein
MNQQARLGGYQIVLAMKKMEGYHHWWYLDNDDTLVEIHVPHLWLRTGPLRIALFKKQFKNQKTIQDNKKIPSDGGSQL